MKKQTQLIAANRRRPSRLSSPIGSDRMTLIFHRTGQRRYAIEANRDAFPDVEMNPAPGYDAFMPHDILHLVVEAVLGLNHGIFGQLAAGGDARAFRPKERSSGSHRDVARERRRLRKRGARLARSGEQESAQSERAAYVCWQEWLSRSPSFEQQRRAEDMSSQATYVRDLMSPDEAERLAEVMDRICVHLDTISLRWRDLDVGESMCVQWPDLSVSAS